MNKERPSHSLLSRISQEVESRIEFQRIWVLSGILEKTRSGHYARLRGNCRVLAGLIRGGGLIDVSVGEHDLRDIDRQRERRAVQRLHAGNRKTISKDRCR